MPYKWNKRPLTKDGLTGLAATRQHRSTSSSSSNNDEDDDHDNNNNNNQQQYDDDNTTDRDAPAGLDLKRQHVTGSRGGKCSSGRTHAVGDDDRDSPACAATSPAIICMRFQQKRSG